MPPAQTWHPHHGQKLRFAAATTRTASARLSDRSAARRFDTASACDSANAKHTSRPRRTARSEFSAMAGEIFPTARRNAAC